MIPRFSSSGLAGACVDVLKGHGVEARIAFKPRGPKDLAPFSVEVVSGCRLQLARALYPQMDGGPN